MRKTILVIFAAALCFSLFSFFIGRNALSGTDDVRRVTKEDLKTLLDDPNTIIIDVRQEGDWQGSDRKIKGAVREDPTQDAASWANKYSKNKNIVLYCT